MIDPEIEISKTPPPGRAPEPRDQEPSDEDPPERDPRDLAPVIGELMRAAKAAVALDTAAGMQAARDLLITAADLKQRLPADASGASPWPPVMSAEEWQSRFKPKA